MLKRYLQLPILIFLVIFASLIFWLINSSHSAKLPATPNQSTLPNPLTVSQDGSQATTNISGADLQQATPPSQSASSTNANPQQSSVNYCSTYEDPTDGCIPAAQ